MGEAPLCPTEEDGGESIQMPVTSCSGPLFLGPKVLNSFCGSVSGAGRQVVGGGSGPPPFYIRKGFPSTGNFHGNLQKKEMSTFLWQRN